MDEDDQFITFVTNFIYVLPLKLTALKLEQSFKSCILLKKVSVLCTILGINENNSNKLEKYKLKENESSNKIDMKFVIFDDIVKRFPFFKIDYGLLTRKLCTIPATEK